MEILCFSGWCFGTWRYYFPIHIWDVILPIDELIFFKIVKITNQFWCVLCMYVYVLACPKMGQGLCLKEFQDPPVQGSIQKDKSMGLGSKPHFDTPNC
jgi:hypothetical protein